DRPTVKVRPPEDISLEKTVSIPMPAVTPAPADPAAEKTVQLSALGQEPAVGIRAAGSEAKRTLPAPARAETLPVEIARPEPPAAPRRRGAAWIARRTPPGRTGRAAAPKPTRRWPSPFRRASIPSS